MPLHLTGYALTLHPPAFASTAPVLLVENPRLVEAAAERGTPFCVVATNGNPASAVIRLVRAMLDAGIEVRHHGDFDAAGIGIVRRLHALGCTPWRMGARDYGDALAVARGLGVELPVEAAGVRRDAVGRGAGGALRGGGRAGARGAGDGRDAGCGGVDGDERSNRRRIDSRLSTRPAPHPERGTVIR